jgi:hypothetical protein
MTPLLAISAEVTERACNNPGQRSDRGCEGLPEAHVWELMPSSPHAI